MVPRVAAATLCAALTCVAAAGATDGGSGTYTATAGTFDFNLFNGGTTAWQYFVVVGTAATRFVGGTTGNEGSARCVVGQPDGQPNEIECGPVPPTVIPPSGHIPFVATLSAFPDCGAPFQLFAESMGEATFTRVGDATFSGSCSAAPPPPRVLTPPTLHGVPAVGRTLTASPATWSPAAARLRYRWQLCANGRCAPIVGATRLTLKLTRRMRRHTVRVASYATFVGGLAMESLSRAVAVR